MKKNKMIFFFLFISYTLGCSSTSKQQSINPIAPETFEKINIGASKNDVLKELGKASEQRTEGQFEHWIYSNNDTDNTQIGSISFDSFSQKVIGVTVIPPLDSKIGQIDFLKNKKNVCAKFIF